MVLTFQHDANFSAPGESMPIQQPPPLSRREREIMDLLYTLNGGTAAEIQKGLSDPPSYSAVRALLRILEEKGHLRHEQQGPRYLYHPTVARESASRSALSHLVKTFFDGSTVGAVTALLDPDSTQLEPEELDRLKSLIEQARQEET
jgi:predicted transcriptional regulator